MSIYSQHIRQPQYQMIQVEEHLRIGGDGKFEIMPFFMISENNKLLWESYESLETLRIESIEKFNP